MAATITPKPNSPAARRHNLEVITLYAIWAANRVCIGHGERDKGTMTLFARSPFWSQGAFLTLSLCVLRRKAIPEDKLLQEPSGSSSLVTPPTGPLD